MYIIYESIASNDPRRDNRIQMVASEWHYTIGYIAPADEGKLPDGSGRTYWDIINTEAEDDYEAEYWTNRLAKQAATDMLFYGRIGTGNMDAILSMDPKQQAETLALTMNFSTQIQSYTQRLQSEAEENLKLQGSVNNESLLAPKEEKQKLESSATDSNEDINDVYNI